MHLTGFIELKRAHGFKDFSTKDAFFLVLEVPATFLPTHGFEVLSVILFTFISFKVSMHLSELTLSELEDGFKEASRLLGDIRDVVVTFLPARGFNVPMHLWDSTLEVEDGFKEDPRVFLATRDAGCILMDVPATFLLKNDVPGLLTFAVFNVPTLLMLEDGFKEGSRLF